MKQGRVATLVVSMVLAAATAAGCGGSDDDGNGGDGGDAGNGDGGGGGDGDGGNSSCTGLECQQVECSGGETTSLSGTVNIPSGDLPLYNAVVYVPNDEVEPFDEGSGCYRCDAPLSGDPVVETTTDTAGRFVLEDVPVGDDIPLVIQVGKWRRQIVIPSVEECVDTPLDAGETRLPKNRSEGDIPRIALTTGGLDALECLLSKVGLDTSEFTPESEDGRVNFYAAVDGTPGYDTSMNGGAAFTPATTLWDSLENLQQYDIVLLSCEGTENPTNKTDLARQNMQDYADLGGRVFASHWHNFWIEFGPDPFPMAATFNHRADLVDIESDIDTSYEKGMAMAEWLMNVDASTTFAKLPIVDAQHTVDAVDLATRWIYLDDTANGFPSVQYLSFNTPMEDEPEEQCGRLVLSDIHVSSASGDQSAPGIRYPVGCTSTDLSPQEKALIFMLFDISSCIEPDVGID
jgi:hypothetical protein